MNKNMKEIKGNYDIATVRLNEDKSDSVYYFALFDPSIVANDTVVVTTKYGLKVGKVTEVLSQNKCSDISVTAEVVSRVDMTEYEKRIESRKRKEELKVMMDKIVAQNQELSVYRMLAQTSPEMEKLLEEYVSL